MARKNKNAAQTAVEKVIECGSMVVSIISRDPNNLDFENKAKSICGTLERCLGALETAGVDFGTQTDYSDDGITSNLLALYELLMLDRLGTLGIIVELKTPLAGIKFINVVYDQDICMMTSRCYDSLIKKDTTKLTPIGSSDRGNDYETDDGQIVHSVFWELLDSYIEIFYEVVI